MITQNNSSSGVDSTRVYSATEGRAGDVTQALWRSSGDHVWIPNVGIRSCEVEVYTWRAQDVRDARAMGYMQRKAANRE